MRTDRSTEWCSFPNLRYRTILQKTNKLIFLHLFLDAIASPSSYPCQSYKISFKYQRIIFNQEKNSNFHKLSLQNVRLLWLPCMGKTKGRLNVGQPDHIRPNLHYGPHLNFGNHIFRVYTTTKIQNSSTALRHENPDRFSACCISQTWSTVFLQSF